MISTLISLCLSLIAVAATSRAQDLDFQVSVISGATLHQLMPTAPVDVTKDLVQVLINDADANSIGYEVSLTVSGKTQTKLVSRNAFAGTLAQFDIPAGTFYTFSRDAVRVTQIVRGKQLR